MRSLTALDWLNFFLADVQSRLGPYLAIYLLTSQQWHEASIGIVMTAAGIATLLAQTPAGALIDATRWKRAMVIGAAALIGVACLVVTLAPDLAIVTAAQIAMGAAAAIFPPAIAAIALGLVGPARFTRRMGRMQAFNHAGNVTAALLAGIVGTLIAPVAVFWLISGFAALTIAAALAVDSGAIDHDLARGFRHGEREDGEQPSGVAVLLESRPLVVFAVAVMLFHLANAAMLPLLGQEFALHDRAEGAFFMSELIVVA